ncbi:MAG: hypothetical protein SO019_08825 [Lachnospiraceae bacterium]|nr:hypothetical protein [Lachnospiraceae bacterium]
MEITLVNEENQSYFAGLAPTDLWKRTDLVLGAIEQEKAVALLMARWQAEDVEILFLYVLPELRRRKTATGLLDTLHLLARIGKRASVRCSYVQTDDRTELNDFFRYHCFEQEATNPLYRIPFGSLKKDVLCRRPKLGVLDRLIPLKKATSGEWMQLVKRMNELRKYDINGVFPELSDSGRFHGLYSFLHLAAGQCVGCILVHEQDGCFVIDFLWNAMNRPPLETVTLLQVAYQEMRVQCEENTIICMNALTKKSRKIIDYFAMDQEPAGMVITQSYTY